MPEENVFHAEAPSPDKVAMEIVRFTRELSFNEEKLLDLVQEHITPVEQFFANYSCAIMEIETKFKVLNEMFSLKYDGNPIENITSRVKDYDSIIRKVIKKNIPRDLTSIEENIHDIAGVRVICSFVEDIYRRRHDIYGECLRSSVHILCLRADNQRDRNVQGSDPSYVQRLLEGWKGIYDIYSRNMFFGTVLQRQRGDNNEQYAAG